MKKVKICYSPAKDIIWERESEPMEVDLSAVEKHYLALGEKHLKPLEKLVISLNFSHFFSYSH